MHEITKILDIPGLTPESRGFHVGAENFLLETIVYQILECSPKTSWNPTTFYGPGGCGKTHLLHGIHQLWKRNRPQSKTLTLTAAEFARAFGVAVETNTTNDFQRRLRETEFWTLDSLEDLKTKPVATEELKRALDEATMLGNTVLFAIARFPGEHDLSKHFSTTLTTRIVSGLTVPILPPLQETRTAMIREIAENFHITISWEIAADLAKTLDVSYPKLLGIFSQIVLESKKQPPDPDFVQKFFRGYEKRIQPTLEEILKFTAKRLSLRQSEIRGKSRSAHIAQGRAIAVFLARQETGHTFQRIGQFFGGRDHKTIMHYCEETEKKLAVDNELRHTIAEIRQTLAGQLR